MKFNFKYIFLYLFVSFWLLFFVSDSVFCLNHFLFILIFVSFILFFSFSLIASIIYVLFCLMFGIADIFTYISQLTLSRKSPNFIFIRNFKRHTPNLFHLFFLLLYNLTIFDVKHSIFALFIFQFIWNMKWSEKSNKWMCVTMRKKWKTKTDTRKWWNKESKRKRFCIHVSSSHILYIYNAVVHFSCNSSGALLILHGYMQRYAIAMILISLLLLFTSYSIQQMQRKDEMSREVREREMKWKYVTTAAAKQYTSRLITKNVIYNFAFAYYERIFFDSCLIYKICLFRIFVLFSFDE